jgi:hypothetical protein
MRRGKRFRFSMLKRKITEAMVEKLKPPSEGDIEFFDTEAPGLILRVGYGGSKNWLVRHYLHRKNKHGKRISVPTTYKLGRYPILKVKEARDKARVFRADPIKAKAEADVGSFRDVAENYIKRYVEGEKQLRTRDEIVRLLTTLVYPRWRDRPFRDIRRGDVSDLLDRIVDNNGSRQADKVLAILRRMMNWYATRHDDYVSVIIKGMGRYPARDRKGAAFCPTTKSGRCGRRAATWARSARWSKPCC